MAQSLPKEGEIDVDARTERKVGQPWVVVESVNHNLLLFLRLRYHHHPSRQKQGRPFPMGRKELLQEAQACT